LFSIFSWIDGRDSKFTAIRAVPKDDLQQLTGEYWYFTRTGAKREPMDRTLKNRIRMQKEPAIPYYVQIAETIKRRILTDQYNQGDLIPPMQELEKEFDVSNITMRKALEALAHAGIIQRKRGIGTVVSELVPEVITFELSGSFQRLVDSVEKLPLEMEVLEITTTPCPKHVQRIFSMEPTRDIWRMKKVRKHMGTPVSYYTHYSDPRWCSGITKKEAGRKNFVELFQQASRINLIRMEQRLKAAVADLDLSALLGINFRDPLFFMENVYYSAQDRPLILTQIYYRGDMCSYKATVQLQSDGRGRSP
jgi:DNA-binding GntR family transcriptional regulator